MIEVFVSGLAYDTLSNAPVVLLKERTGNRFLTIWIGPSEAGAIALELSGVSYKRPLTHDLLKSVLNGLDAIVQKVVVSSLKDNTFYAKFYIKASENAIIEIDARPSDSIAMALKMKAPIYISEELDESMIELSPNAEDPDDEADTFLPLDLKKRLRNINPEDFGDFNL
ncbi:bifunctional nuclease family protein [bacterium]|nr:bifunctional nuclease family protein [bacterium]